MSESGRVALPDVWYGREALPNVHEWLGGLPGYPGVVEMPCRMSEKASQPLPDIREVLLTTPGHPGVVMRTSRMFDSGREDLPHVRE